MPSGNNGKTKGLEELFAQKMPTGIPGLDHLLCGGLTRTNSLLIEGAPGTGKSTLGVEILVRGAELYEEPGIMVAFEEFPRQLYAEYAGYGFDLEGLEKKGLLRIIWTDPRRVISGFTGKDDLVGRIVDEMQAKRLLIDSITHFRRVASGETDLREVLYRVLNNLKLKGVNSILIKELEKGDSDNIAFEEYVVDASLRVINHVSESGKNRRLIQVRKTRGQRHIPGYHPFDFEEDGIRLYPKLTTADIMKRIPRVEPDPSRKSTGVAGFDALIEGGIPSGSLNILVGYSGTGKKSFSRHFLLSRLREGEKVLFLTFQETEKHFLATGGAELENYRESGSLDFWLIPPFDLNPEKFLHELIERIRIGEPSNIIIQSVSDLRSAVPDLTQLRELQHLLAFVLRRAGLTALLLVDSEEMCGLIRLNELDFARLADSVIQLSFAEVDGKIHRFIGVMKMAGTNHTKDLHEFIVTPEGMQIRRRATGLSGILSGNTAGQMKEVAEQVLDPLSESSEILGVLARSDGLEEEYRRAIVSAREKLGIADIVLREHFGFTDLTSFAEEFQGDHI